MCCVTLYRTVVNSATYYAALFSAVNSDMLCCTGRYCSVLHCTCYRNSMDVENVVRIKENKRCIVFIEQCLSYTTLGPDAH